MIDLLDANVWVSLTVPDHVHHGRAARYWQSEGAERVAFCRVTVLALMRHLTNAAIMRAGVLTSTTAWDRYQRWLDLPEILLLAEPADLDTRLGRLSRSHDLRPHRWTDAYLAAFAQSSQCRLVSFDGGFHAYRDLDFHHLEA